MIDMTVPEADQAWLDWWIKQPVGHLRIALLGEQYHRLATDIAAGRMHAADKLTFVEAAQRTFNNWDASHHRKDELTNEYLAELRDDACFRWLILRGKLR